MKTNNLITSIVLIFIALNVYSQNLMDVPKNGKPGDLFCYDNKTNEWTKINPKLIKIKKEGKLKALQYKLKNLNYDIEITNCIDKKTMEAFEAFEAEKTRVKNEKKVKRKSERLKRKIKRRERHSNKVKEKQTLGEVHNQ